MDTFGSIDPFIIVDFGHKVKSKIVNNDKNAKWYEELYVIFRFILLNSFRYQYPYQ